MEGGPFTPNEVVQTDFPSNFTVLYFMRQIQNGEDIGGMEVYTDREGIAYVADGTSRTEALIRSGLGDIPANYVVTRTDIDTPDLSYLD